MQPPSIDGFKWMDKYGQIWIRTDLIHVWKFDTGYGGWFDGHGLRVTR